MTRNAFRILKDLNMHKQFILMLILRMPFDFLNALISANMIERFVRLMEIKDEDSLLPTFLLFLLLTVLLFAYNMTIWSTLAIRINILFQKKLRKKVLGSLLSRTQGEMEEYAVGDWITRLNNDIDKVNDYLDAPINFMHMMIAATNLFLSSIMLILLNFSLFCIAIIIMVPFFFLSSVIIIRKVPFFRRNAQESFAKYNNWVAPIIAGKDAIRIFDGKKTVEEKTEKISLDILHQNMQAHKRIAWTYFFNTFSGVLGYILLLLTGGSMIGNGVENFAELTKITQYRGEMMKSTMCINNCIGNMRSNYPSVERIQEVTNPQGVSQSISVE